MNKAIVFKLLFLFSFQCFADADIKLCHEFLQVGKNYKIAHLNENCISAAKAGSGAAQYSLGMSYGFAGNADLEREYYEKAAKLSIPAAFLALGHLYRSKDMDKSAYWYERYANLKQQGYGYTSLLLARIYSESGNMVKKDYWLSMCKSSPYGDNCVL
jgi:hypothetical protein